MTEDLLGRDLRLQFRRGRAELVRQGQDLETVSGIDALIQALQLRLLTDYKDLSQLGHPAYGSRLRDLIGEPLDRANRELMRRYVRQSLREDERVDEVLNVAVNARNHQPDIIEVNVSVRAITGDEAEFEVAIHAH